MLNNKGSKPEDKDKIAILLIIFLIWEFNLFLKTLPKYVVLTVAIVGSIASGLFETSNAVRCENLF